MIFVRDPLSMSAYLMHREYIIFHYNLFQIINYVVAIELKCDIVLSEFKLQSLYYVYFWSNTLIPSSNDLIVPPPSFYNDGFGI